ncbi:MAG: TIGR03790 family protein [Verrucomicrobiota bacterium]|jgi:uncharacterized protein (TIGR03790 family)
MKYLCLLLLLASLTAHAGGDEVVVVYNSRMPESKAVAEHYVAARNVPAKQVFGFALTTNDIITRADFADFLQKPLAADLEAAGLWKFGDLEIPAHGTVLAHTENRVVASKIRYAVLCYGVPLKIAPSSMLEGVVGTLKGPEGHRDEAAVDSELAWLPLLKMAVPLGGPLPNRLYGCTNHDLLSPTNGILLVARLDGPTPAIANHLVDQALAAETNGLLGRAYFDTRNEPTNSTYYLGDAWMLAGAELCRELGYDVEVDTNSETFPASYSMSQIAIYAGWYDENVSGPFTLPKVEFMPGAFAYHLHSYSAETLRTTGTHWCGPLLAKGATCTMGFVYEPYLTFTPNIPLFIRCWGAGYTFGEAAWAAQPALSWQTTVIGDPLYQPYKSSPLELHSRLARTHNPLIEWSFERMVNLDRTRGARDPQVALFLENLPATAQSAVLTEKLADIYDALGKPESAIAAWQRALQLNPSPQQRIRIRRTLEPKLLAAGRKADAIEDDQKLLAESPQYPGKSQVEAELKDLTQESPADNRK